MQRTPLRRRSVERAAAVVVAAAVLLSACSGDDPVDAVPPEASTIAVPTLAPAPEADTREVRFTTADGQELAGTVFGEGSIGVVLAHMRGRDRTTWFDFARRSAAAGHRTLAFDFRGYGGSTGTRDENLATDLSAAVDFLRADGAERIVVVGASMGGTAAVNVAAQFDVDAAVSLSAPASFGTLPAVDVAADVAEPLLVVVAEMDQPFADAAVLIDEAAPSSQLLVFDGSAHGTNLFAEHEAELTRLMLDFIARTTS